MCWLIFLLLSFLQTLASKAGEKENTLKDQLATEAAKRGEVERNIARLQEQLKKHAEELEAVKANSFVHKKAMEKAIGDAKSV